jgi:hypothetical protein
VKKNAKEVVMSYINGLDSQKYEAALECLDKNVRIKGPAGENFGKPTDFIEMLRKYHGRYDVKKVFIDGKDVCLWYDLKTAGPTVFMTSWYQVNEDDGLIISIQTLFDPKAFGPPPQK